ncbi:MAG: dUTP diphosphatase [Planctomycetes bacterium]|nr:dUTP diphosphatase [Planctomycetota bacterium]NUQ34635.1 dUTP diphosphatase [Planctomycetaceae bacterium]
MPNDLTMRISRTIAGKELALPAYASEAASGLDLRACIDKAIVFNPGEHGLVPTGISVEIPRGYEGQVRPRSGLALKHGIMVVNSPGTIDADYRGEIKVILGNFGREPFTVNFGDRIAQLVICPVVRVSLEEVQSLTESARGAGGFGSTGKS